MTRLIANWRWRLAPAVLLMAGCVVWLPSTKAEEPPIPKKTPATQPAEEQPIAEPTVEDGKLPAELQDPAFDRYVDLRKLGQATAESDAAQAADVALLLAEGERILLRQHKAMSAAQAFQVAVKIAVEKRDKATLERLATFAKNREDKGLATFVTQAQALAGAARASDPLFQLSADSATPEQFALLHRVARDLECARVSGDATRLALTVEEVKGAGEELLTAARKTALIKKIEAAQAGSKEVSADAQKLAEVLDKLQGSARGTLPPHVILYSKAGGGGNQVGMVFITGQTLMSYTPSTLRGFINDEARSIVLHDLRANTKITLFDSSKGRAGRDDELEIYVKKDFRGSITIGSLEKTFENDFIQCVYTRKDNLNGKVSRMDISYYPVR